MHKIIATSKLMKQPKNYYESLIAKIKTLIKNQEIAKAIQLIETEFALPYIPQIYEEQLAALYAKIKPEKKAKTAVFNKSEILEIFLHFQAQHSNQFLLEIAQMMMQYSWVDALAELQTIFNLKTIEANVKAMIYNILALQNVDHLFTIGQLKLNPMQHKTLFESDFAVVNFAALEQLNLAEPTLIDVAKQALIFYLMNQFPQAIFFNQEDLSQSWIMIAKLMLGQIEIDQLNTKQQQLYQIIKSGAI